MAMNLTSCTRKLPGRLTGWDGGLRGRGIRRLALAMALAAFGGTAMAILPSGTPGPKATPFPQKLVPPRETASSAEPHPTPAPAAQFYIREYRVMGSHVLNPEEVQEAVYPFLGPGRTPDDVEQARAALEKAYRDKGFQTVNVQIPEQRAARGIVLLQVVENKVGRLRVKGSRYYSLEEIKRRARPRSRKAPCRISTISSGTSWR